MSDKLTSTLIDFFKQNAIPAGATIGVGVSGGADSLCLARRLALLAPKLGFSIRTATVNHGLRPEAKTEAELTKAYMARLGVPHDTLYWKGPKPTARLEERAREKRYDLLKDWCHSHQIRHLFLAHQAEDEAETFWTRLTHGSGIDGLGAIAPIRPHRDILICRPFLKINRAQLEADLKQAGWTWATDNMNHDPTYERVRWRHRQSTLSEMGLTPACIGRATERLRRAREALDFYTEIAIRQTTLFQPEGFAVIHLSVFQELPTDMQIRVITTVLNKIGTKQPRLEQTELWLRTFPARATLGGCHLIRRHKTLFVAREASRMPAAQLIPADTPTYWDRFRITTPIPTTVMVNSPKSIVSDLPFLVRQSVPVLQSDPPLIPLFRIITQKELEKDPILDYKKRDKNIALIELIMN